MKRPWIGLLATLGREDNVHLVSAFSYVLVWSLALGAEGEGSLRMPKELEHAEIIDKAGAQLPLDISLTNQDGHKVLLKDYFTSDDARPVLLTLGYYGCPMLCSLVLNGLVEGLKAVSFKLGRDYRIVSVSIDDRESPDLAKKKQEAYLEALGQKAQAEWWQFHVSDKASIQELADSVGFGYNYDAKTNQFAHGAGFFVLTPSGILSRTLFGISFKPTDIKLAIHEAADGKIGSFLDRVILSCFHYNPDAHGYGIYIMGVMRLAGVVMVVVFGIVLLVYFREDRKRMKNVIG